MRFMLAMLAWCALIALPTGARAGLYHPDVLGAFDIDDEGHAVPLSPDSFLITLGNIKEIGWNSKNLLRPEPPERYLEFRKSIEARRNRGVNQLAEEEKLSFCADLLRSSEERDRSLALDILSRFRSRDHGFLTNTYYAYALRLHGQQGQQQRDALARAREAHDYPFPIRLAGLSKKQLDWYQRFEKMYHLAFLAHRVRLGEAPAAPDQPKAPLQVDPLFRSKEKGEPIRYVGESGEFEIGAIAAVEAAKLPADALAIVQQLVLWYPNDDRLMWQLAELYNANGDLKTADQLFDRCIRDLHIDSAAARRHRTLVNERVEEIRAEMQRLQEEKQKAEEEKKRRAAEEKRQREVLVGVIVALVLVVLVYWQTRELLRRHRERIARSVPRPKTPSE